MEDTMKFKKFMRKLKMKLLVYTLVAITFISLVKLWHVIVLH